MNEKPLISVSHYNRYVFYGYAKGYGGFTAFIASASTVPEESKAQREKFNKSIGVTSPPTVPFWLSLSEYILKQHREFEKGSRYDNFQ